MGKFFWRRGVGGRGWGGKGRRGGSGREDFFLKNGKLFFYIRYIFFMVYLEFFFYFLYII